MKIPTPFEVQKSIQLAFALEPLDYKQGLTNRQSDYNEFTKLQYFIVGAINIGPVFFRLTEKLREKGRKPPFYQFCFEAQEYSCFNRGGYKINYGGIIALMPIIITQFLASDKYETIPELLTLVPETLKKYTNKDDVKFLDEMRNFAAEMSPFEEVKDLSKRGKNILDYYTYGAEQDGLTLEPTPLYANGEVLDSKFRTGASDREIINGYPLLTEMWKMVEEAGADHDLIGRVEDAWYSMLIRHPQDWDAHPTWLADLSTAIYYLIFSTTDEWTI